MQVTTNQLVPCNRREERWWAAGQMHRSLLPSSRIGPMHKLVAMASQCPDTIPANQRADPHADRLAPTSMETRVGFLQR